MAKEATTAPAFVAAVFEAWRRDQIHFLVLRNYEGLPAHTTNDIDVLVRRKQLAKAERTLIVTARQCGFRLHNRAPFATLALYFSAIGGTEQVHFDLFTQLLWRGFRYLDSRQFLDRRLSKGLFAVPHPVDEAVTNLLAHSIYSGRIKEKYRPGIRAALEAYTAEAEHLLAPTYGRRNARFITRAVLQEEWEKIERRIPRLRFRMVTRHLNHRPFSTLFTLGKEAFRVLRRFLRPAGCSVVLCGADGCGKSTAAQTAMEILAPTFSSQKSVRYHWKPPVLTASRRAGRSGENPHGKTVRSRAASVPFFAFHWFEFFLGSWMVIPLKTFKGGLVAIDRFYYDFFVDLRRYRLNVPEWLVRIGMAPLRKPDLVFLLDAPVEVLQARKQEVPPEETARQRKAYLDLVKGLPNGIIIDATQPAELVAQDLARSILEHSRLKTGQKI